MRRLFLPIIVSISLVGQSPSDKAFNPASSKQTRESTFISQLRIKANQRDAETQYELGVCYIEGKGVYGDPVEAVKWFRKAAKQGHAKAQFRLGVRYVYGQGVPRDEPEAVKWFLKAAEQGDVNAEYFLSMYLPKEDHAKALQWLQKAAEHGHVQAQYILGLQYDVGFPDFPQDFVEAVKWYKKAAEQDDVNAQFNLGVCYEQGKGVIQNDTEALTLYRIVANLGERRAQRILGIRYAQGKGLPKDDIEAYAWLVLSQPFQLCATPPLPKDLLVESLEKKFTPESLQQAKKRIEQIQQGFEPSIRNPFSSKGKVSY